MNTVSPPTCVVVTARALIVHNEQLLLVSNDGSY